MQKVSLWTQASTWILGTGGCPVKISTRKSRVLSDLCEASCVAQRAARRVCSSHLAG